MIHTALHFCPRGGAAPEMISQLPRWCQEEECRWLFSVSKLLLLLSSFSFKVISISQDEPYSLPDQNTKREQGRKVQLGNVQAAKVSGDRRPCGGHMFWQEASRMAWSGDPSVQLLENLPRIANDHCISWYPHWLAWISDVCMAGRYPWYWCDGFYVVTIGNP